MPTPLFRRLALIAAAFALGVIVFGAFVRLSNAGLSCPDWPTCYGKVSWPTHASDIATANSQFERAVDTGRAWREQVHRQLAGTLGLLVLALALLSAWQRRWGRPQIVLAAALVAGSIPLYVQQLYGAAATLAITGELLLLALAWRSGQANDRQSPYTRLCVSALMLIVFQALLGMWTVTWLLKPIVVMGHLIGGLSSFALLAWLALRSHGWQAQADETLPGRGLVISGLGLLALQIALGGWTSANYAAWACGTDFPSCLGQWWPTTDFREGFVLWRGIGVDYEGGVLDGPARVAIQLAHRLLAVLVSAQLLVIAIKAMRLPVLRRYGLTLLAALLAQLTLGIANVKLGLPLTVAALHNAGAALLLLCLLALLARISPIRRIESPAR